MPDVAGFGYHYHVKLLCPHPALVWITNAVWGLFLWAGQSAAIGNMVAVRKAGDNRGKFLWCAGTGVQGVGELG